jgi:predicted DNA-binding transcriptional regulator YafY
MKAIQVIDSRLAATRPPLERMVRIMAEIQAGMYPNANTLAAKLEVSRKTIERDIEFLRSRLNVPIDYDPRRWGFFYTHTMGPAQPAFILTRTPAAP